MKSLLRNNETELLDPTASRTIKPRKLAKPCTYPVVAIDESKDGAYALSEVTGQVITLDTYSKQLYKMPRTLVITFGAETVLWKLHQRWKDHPRWTWRVSVSQKDNVLRKRVGYFGFKEPLSKKHRYHLVIDARTFFRGHDQTPHDLLKMGVELREFCNANGLAIRASASGIAAQLLRHPLFYPCSRRRVPGFVNDAARNHLPGGHYESYKDAGQRLEAVHYIDQENAYHHAAEVTPLPNANSVRAQGYDRYDYRPWARKGGRLYDRALANHGLVRALVNVPDFPTTRLNGKTQTLERGLADFVPRSLRTPGKQVVHLWTNEIAHLQSLGLEIEHLISVWGTDEVDRGLCTYARWAKQQARKHPYLKALFLMPYGLLAQNDLDVTFHLPGGTETLLLANQQLDDTFAIPTKIKPATANVLQLGLIQAFVRSLSLDFARQASEGGHDIVSVYVDGVFVKLTEGKQLPIFTPWRIKEEYQRIELASSLRVPVRARVKRDYQLTH